MKNPLKVAVIAPTYKKAEKATLMAYPTAVQILFEVPFDEIIWPEDWPEEREGTRLEENKGSTGKKPEIITSSWVK